jgi:hypothetical protein
MKPTVGSQFRFGRGELALVRCGLTHLRNRYGMPRQSSATGTGTFVIASTERCGVLPGQEKNKIETNNRLPGVSSMPPHNALIFRIIPRFAVFRLFLRRIPLTTHHSPCYPIYTHGRTPSFWGEPMV